MVPQVTAYRRHLRLASIGVLLMLVGGGLTAASGVGEIVGGVLLIVGAICLGVGAIQVYRRHRDLPKA